MQEFPHHYQVASKATAEGPVTLSAEDLPPLETAPPKEFGGPGGSWSPEALLVGAVTDCFILTFRAIARASKLEWVDLQCSTEGTLDRVDRVTRFTEFNITAQLTVPAGTDADKAKQLLEKAEANCLVSSSLNSSIHLHASVETVS